MERLSFAVKRLDQGTSFKAKAYMALRQAITQMDIYGHDGEIRLDERQLCEALGVSRTPVREAMALLEQEGFIRSQPRRGIFVVRKTKAEIIEMITVCAALEGMAARLVVERADDAEIGRLAEPIKAFPNTPADGQVGDYSDANVSFHQRLVQASGCGMIGEITERFFVHMRAIRKVTMRTGGRADRSIAEHHDIMEALEKRDADLAERRVREHTLGLARYVEQHCDFLD
ncbi:GntR family transcriptional regulator [Azospirillum sp. ST 5-10]|uniref:GntR family transcriptional regulator n=1 Tax=unclassified Azospirillum TaxID=2630922 RepID=UPI003F49BAF1